MTVECKINLRKLFSGYTLGNAELQVSYSKPIETLCIDLFWLWGQISPFLVTYRLFGFKIPKLLFLNKYLSV